METLLRSPLQSSIELFGLVVFAERIRGANLSVIAERFLSSLKDLYGRLLRGCNVGAIVIKPNQKSIAFRLL